LLPYLVVSGRLRGEAVSLLLLAGDVRLVERLLPQADAVRVPARRLRLLRRLLPEARSHRFLPLLLAGVLPLPASPPVRTLVLAL
jgi:hypothetical protein